MGRVWAGFCDIIDFRRCSVTGQQAGKQHFRAA
jgi:hypothetical protein